MTAIAMNGLQLMQAMANREVPLPNIAKLIPMLDGEAQRGKMTIRVRANNDHLNTQGIVHGGFTSAVLDTVMACAIQTLLGSNSGVATIDLGVKYVRAVPTDIDLFAEGWVDDLTAQIGYASGQIVDDEGTVYATASASCMLLKDQKMNWG